jgi:hypothetical protein
MKVFKQINGLGDIPHFNVTKQPLFTAAGIQIPKLFSLTRDDTNNHIGICSNIYRPIQIDEMVDTIETACRGINAHIDHVGFAENSTGSQLVIQSKIGDIGISSDPVEGYFYTIIDHRGKSSNKIVPSTIRIACTNALHLVMKDARESRSPSLRHSTNFDQRVEDFRANIAFNIEYATGFAKTAETLRNQRFTKDDMVKLVETIIPKDKDESSRIQTKRDKIMLKFGGGIANEGATKWDALNAVTEFETHQKTSPNKFIRNLTFNTLSTKTLEYLKAA